MLKDSLDLMKIKNKLQNALKGEIDPSLLDKLPSGYSVIGDIAIFHHINKELNTIKEHIGDLIIQFDPQVSVVVEQIETKSIYRKPVIEHIAGEKRALTIHKEYNTLFHIDIFDC